MTQEDFFQIESSQKQHHETMEHQSKMNVLVEAEEMNLFSILKPKISIDGKRYCVLYGEDQICGVAGFGDTLMLAIYDFNKKIHTPISYK